MAKRTDQITFSRLLTEFRRWLEGNGSSRGAVLRGYDEARLNRAFGRYRLCQITERRITDYGLSREAAGATPEIINGELRTLGRLMDRARDAGHIATVPTIWFLSEPRRIESPHSALVLQRMMGLGQSHRDPRDEQRPSPSRRGKLDDAQWASHLAKHPMDRKLSAAQRAALLAKDQGIRVDRTTITKRLSAIAKKESARAAP